MHLATPSSTRSSLPGHLLKVNEIALCHRRDPSFPRSHLYFTEAAIITFRTGSIFDSPAQTLVNPINCVGVMGKGLALQFKTRFPAMHADYLLRCHLRIVRLGHPYLFAPTTPPWILNFPTKRHWRDASSPKDIEQGLRFLMEHLTEWGITSLAIPALGCGLGGLNWGIVKPLLYRCLDEVPIPTELYTPSR